MQFSDFHLLKFSGDDDAVFNQHDTDSLKTQVLSCMLGILDVLLFFPQVNMEMEKFCESSPTSRGFPETVASVAQGCPAACKKTSGGDDRWQRSCWESGLPILLSMLPVDEAPESERQSQAVGLHGRAGGEPGCSWHPSS